MNPRLWSLLDVLEIPADRITPVHGGDINDSFRLSGNGNRAWFVKVNKSGQPKDIITTEFHGLEMMRSRGVKIIPSDIRHAENARDACLVMPFYEKTVRVTDSDWVEFFQSLARMHLISQEVFGGTDNFIGSLRQVNSTRNNWVPFYRDNRLLPQWYMAREDGWLTSRDTEDWERLLGNLPELMPIERPALIHGDLWSGNVLPTDKGILLIDPCPYFGHREMDLAMMRLFSGIPVESFQSVYENIYPLEPGWTERIEIYQLYYLMVHLNLFGKSYLPAVRRIIQRFS